MLVANALDLLCKRIGKLDTPIESDQKSAKTLQKQDISLASNCCLTTDSGEEPFFLLVPMNKSYSLRSRSSGGCWNCWSSSQVKTWMGMG